MNSTTPKPSARVHPFALTIFILGFAALFSVSAINTIRRNLQAPEAGATDRSRPDGPPRIVVTIPPLMWIARELAPPDAQVTLLVPPGVGCHGIELLPSQVAALREADAVLMVGLGLDTQAEQAERPAWQERLVLGSFVESLGDHDHAHGADEHLHDHAHDHGVDPHAWLDPMAMKSYIGAVSSRFSARWPDHAGVISTKADALRAKADEVDRAYRERLSPLVRRTVVTHHNAWGRIADRYNLDVAAVIQPLHEVESTPGDIIDAAEVIKARAVPAIFIEPQFSKGAAERLAQSTGVRVLTLDPLGDGDWPGMMMKNLDSLVAGLGDAEAN